MGTIGTRGVLAVAFIASTGLLTGMASLPPGDGALPGPVGHEARVAQSEGLLDRALHRACLISVAATRSDLRTAADREQECR